MRYGRILKVDPSAVETPAIGFNLFQSTVDGQWYTIDNAGTIRPLVGSSDNPLAPQGVAEGSADAITVTLPGIGSYSDGDLYIFVATADNTGATTIDINGLGVKSVVTKGDVAADLTAGQIASGDVVVGTYESSTDAVHYVGKVVGEKVYLRMDYDFTEIAAIGGAATLSTFQMFFLPTAADIFQSISRATTIFAGPSITAATQEIQEDSSAYDFFASPIDMTDPLLGGSMMGIISDAGFSDRNGIQVYTTNYQLTGNNWDQVSAGVNRVDVAWGFNTL